MRIEITEKLIRHDGHEYLAGTQTVPDDIGGYFCANGWAKRTDSPDAPRSTEPVELEVASVRHESSSSDL